jgi:hypothetical protein
VFRCDLSSMFHPAGRSVVLAPVPTAGRPQSEEASRFSDAQTAFILRADGDHSETGADGMPVADVCRRGG